VWLWGDRSLLAARREKAARALVGIHRVLERSRPLEGREGAFLALYRQLSELPTAAFTRAWDDPFAYFWVRVAWEALRSLRSGAALAPLARAHLALPASPDAGELAAALADHLAGGWRLLLGAGVATPCDLDLAAPLALPLPAAIPGTELALYPGSGRDGGVLEVTDVRDGRVRGRMDGAPVELSTRDARAPDAAPVRVLACPVVRAFGCAVRMQPLLFLEPALDCELPASGATLELQRSSAGLLEAALEQVRRHQPATLEQIAEHVRVVAFRRPRPGSTRNNMSHPDLPGAILASAVQSPVWMAHVLVHEFHHHRLFCIEERGPLFRDPVAAVEDARFASPWRRDPRPLHGILHGLYVHVPVADFWLSLLASGPEEPSRALALDRSLRSWHQMRMAADLLTRHAELSDLGRTVLDALRDDVDAVGARIRALGLPADAPAVVCREDGTLAEAGEAGGPGGASVLADLAARRAPPLEAGASA
jgi:HEXXH motif-containing protein